MTRRNLIALAASFKTAALACFGLEPAPLLNWSVTALGDLPTYRPVMHIKALGSYQAAEEFARRRTDLDPDAIIYIMPDDMPQDHPAWPVCDSYVYVGDRGDGVLVL